MNTWETSDSCFGLAEIQHQGYFVENHNIFNDKSDLYERARPHYPLELFEYLASLCPTKQLAWDSACGNGQAAMGLANAFKRVVATDISERQIENAKPHPKIQYAISSSENIDLEDDSCDLVCVAQALHWFDLDLFWPEAQRVLKPNGIFSAFGYTWPSVSKEIDEVVRLTFMDVIEPYWAENNRLLWDHYRQIDFPFKKIEPPEFLMTIEWNLIEYSSFLKTFSATRRCIDELGESFFLRSFEAVHGVWGNPDTKKTVVLDFVVYVGQKTTA